MGNNLGEAIERMRIRLGDSDADEELLQELLQSATQLILARRFPFGYDPDEVVFPKRYEDLRIRVAMDLYNKMGAEGQLSHSENGMQRTYESSWVSESLLREVTPMVGVVK